MNEGLIPSRYAKALYKYATDCGDADKVYSQMKVLEESFSTVSSLQGTIDNPYLPAKDKERVLLTAANGAESDNIARFFKLVIRNNRVNLMRSIAIAFQDLYRKANSIERVTITTASALPEEETEKIKAIVAETHKGMKLEFLVCVNPDIIGGFTIKVESEILDASIKNELKKLRLKLLS